MGVIFMKNLCIGCGMEIYKSGTADPYLCIMCEQAISEGKIYPRLSMTL